MSRGTNRGGHGLYGRGRESTDAEGGHSVLVQHTLCVSQV